MKIIFDLRKTGLGNNGGSSTLIKSGNMLQRLGHTIIFVDSGANKHTWVDLDCLHKIVKSENDLPDADFIIATGYKSVGPTVSAPKRCGVKLHWIRAWETWQYPENDIVEKILRQPTIKIVNSICLKNKLLQYGFNSEIIYPGYDFTHIFPLNIRDKTKYLVVGGLYREGVHGVRKRVDWLLNAATIIKSEYPNVKVFLFGSEKQPVHSAIDKYIRSPDMSDKNQLYNMCSIWLAPTMSEGLHLPPAEAMLTECPVVGTNAELSGMQDYLIDGETGIVSDNIYEDFLNKIKQMIEIDNEKRICMGRNARNKILNIGSREKNMNEFINLLGVLK